VPGITTRVTYTVPDPPTDSFIQCIGRTERSVLFSVTVNFRYIGKYLCR